MQVLAKGWEVEESCSQWSCCLPRGLALGLGLQCREVLWGPPTWARRPLDLGFCLSLQLLLDILQLPK